ncbi:MAG: FkbM family methyltransferase [Rhizobacter sp.]|nr:FkbM family methyltransferase [Ferruginibacter sp.]
MDKNYVELSLKAIGKDEKLRNKFLDFVKEVETEMAYKGSVRDDITRHLVDALFEKKDFVIKSNQAGIKYKFLTGIGSKVAREFLLSTPEVPEYAWEPQTTRLLLFLSEKAKNVIIGGAYFGDQALPIAKQIENNAGVVHAFDLNETQLAVLKENMEFNSLNNIEVVAKGLWNNSTTFLNLSETDDLAFASPSTENNASNTITIDDYLEAKGLPGVDLIMLDIEGSELMVLEGAVNQLKKEKGYPNIVFEIHSSYVDWSNGLNETPIVKLLKSHGYKVYSVRDFQGNYDMQGKAIELILPEETVIDGPPHGFNMLAVKDEAIIEDKIFTMCKNVSPKYILHKDPSMHHHAEGFKK